MNRVGPPWKFQIVAGVGGRGLKGGRAQTLRSEMGGAYRGPKSQVLILGVQCLFLESSSWLSKPFLSDWEAESGESWSQKGKCWPTSRVRSRPKIQVKWKEQVEILL